MNPILVTGATGYIGGRLTPRLLERGYSVRVLVRNPAQLQGRAWLPRVTIVQGDALNPAVLAEAMQGVEAAYYLIHSMSRGNNFQQRDLEAARAFGLAAQQAGVKRIIYLGGLGDPEHSLSPHLRSRQEVGKALAACGVPVIEFRSAVIIGSGSAAFEMMRYTVEGMPILFCPPWVETHLQPISVRDVLDYLMAALDLPDEQVGQRCIVEIGGADVVTYHEMMRGYAQARGLRRPMITLPFLPLKVCAVWLHWITPIPARLVFALIEGMRNEVVVRDDSARRLFPDIRPRDYATSLERALARISADQVETTWSDSQVSTTGDVIPVTLTTQEGLLIERRRFLTTLPAETVYRSFTGLGGERGWLYANWVWQARGIIDRLIGGVGFRRGRRHPDELRVGDALDFWRVEALEPNRLMRLRAEMKVPGKAWLQFEVMPQSPGKNLVMQTAFFEPKGLPGLLYWYLLYPIHGFIFSGLIRKVIERARQLASRSASESEDNHPKEETP
ncbi:MAG: SDR family oxidoreductase [Anaerolineales bacterium]